MRHDEPEIVIRRAVAEDAPAILSILEEAEGWLRDRGMPLWFEFELRPEDIARHAAEGLYYLAEVGGEVAGTFRFELVDPDFWPEVPPGESAFIHRLAVRRAFAGGRISAAMLAWAARYAAELGCSYLRLDCDAARPRLRAVYEGFGFRYHSDYQSGPFHVARYELPLT